MNIQQTIPRTHRTYTNKQKNRPKPCGSNNSRRRIRKKRILMRSELTPEKCAHRNETENEYCIINKYTMKQRVVLAEYMYTHKIDASRITLCIRCSICAFLFASSTFPTCSSHTVFHSIQPDRVYFQAICLDNFTHNLCFPWKNRILCVCCVCVCACECLFADFVLARLEALFGVRRNKKKLFIFDILSQANQ